MTAVAVRPTLRLGRAASGGFPLGEQPPGNWRVLTPRERDAVFARRVALQQTKDSPLILPPPHYMRHLLFLSAIVILPLSAVTVKPPRYNVLFIISDDLTSTALSCYGNPLVRTPNIDALAARGTRFTRAYCQGTYCGPSRASFMSGYYPHATGALGYANPRPRIGDRATWSQYFIQAGYQAVRVSKIFHMGVPGGIEYGGDPRKTNHGNGADDEFSWTERFNSPGPE